ncbi:MAG: SpoIIE family protein phosphatase [bacterium]|nr:SpoIIE family protein phosphatase [bacterium]
MNTKDSLGPRIIEILGHDFVEQIFARFESILRFPLSLIDLAGNVVVNSTWQGFSEYEHVRYFIDRDQHQVQVENPDEPHADLLSAAPLHVKDELDSYVLLLHEGELPAIEVPTLGARLLADLLSEKAYSEYELESLTEELIERYNEVNLIYDITEELGAVFDPKTVCDVILKKAVRVIGVDKASVMLHHEADDRLYVSASYGIDLPADELNRISITPGDGVSGSVFSSGEHMLIENIEHRFLPEILHTDSLNTSSNSDMQPARGYKKQSFLSVPMVCAPEQAEKKVMGVINMTEKQSSDMFTSGDLQLVKTIASQAAMSLYNIRLIEEVKDAERVKREMEIAQQIQMGLLPTKPPLLPGIELAGRCLPATQVGGDYYDFFLSPDNKLGLVIADVSGHNVGAALMMAAARSTLRSEVLTERSPAKILGNTNFVLYDDLTLAELFITMFYAEYDVNTRSLRYSNGGHNHPIVLREGGSSFLDAEGMLIGLLESVDFEEKTIALQDDDFVIFYTDGVVEAVNEAGEMFKLYRFCEVLESNWQRSSAHDLLHIIYEELEKYSGTTLRSDDITVVVLKVH